jgi:arginase
MREIQIICAPSILGLKPGGVERLAETILQNRFAEKIHSWKKIIQIPTKNREYSFERDKKTKCLNPSTIHDFSLDLIKCIQKQIRLDNFPIVLGGDCSILLGIMPALKRQGEYGLIFIDAHADFYLPSQSPTGEVADIDLAIVTGQGPAMLANIMGLNPYVKIKNVIHVGQRDAIEAKKYGSQDIKHTPAACFDMDLINRKGITNIVDLVAREITRSTVRAYWLHFDADVLNDNENPAVDYRIPGGLSFAEAEILLGSVLKTGKIMGLSLTIFNPEKDLKNKIGKKITSLLANAIMFARNGRNEALNFFTIK